MPSWRDYLLFLCAGLLVGAGALGVYDTVAVSAGTDTEGHSARSTLSALPDPFPGVSRLTLVLMGADDREGEAGRSDTLMVLWLNPLRQRAALISLPRDLRTTIPGHGTTKINHAYAYGGPELTVRTVEHLLQTKVDGYVKVNFEGFVKAVDVLGGVEIDVEDVEGKGRGMNYDDNWGNLHIHLTPGRHHLDGYQAMGFCRYRKSNYSGLGDGDFKRAERQQQFIRAMLEQHLRVTNLPGLLKAGREIMACIDTTLSWREVVDLTRVLKQMDSGDILSAVLPVGDSSVGGVYYCTLRESAFNDLRADFERHLEGLSARQTPVTVLNGSGVKGAARRAADRLEEAGFEIKRVATATGETQVQTVARCSTGDAPTAAAVVAALGAGEVIADTQGMSESGVITIIVGKDLGDQLERGDGTGTAGESH